MFTHRKSTLLLLIHWFFIEFRREIWWTSVTMVKENKSSKARMCVVKRDGRNEPVHFDKITSRIQKLCYGLDMDFIDPPAITLKVRTILLRKFITLKKYITGTLPPPTLYSSAFSYQLGHLWALCRCHNCWAGQFGSWNRCYNDNQTPGLCHPSGPYRSLKSAQGNQESFQRCHDRPI